MKTAALPSAALVAAQFLLIGLLLVPVGTLLPVSASDIPGVLCVLASLVLVVVAYRSMRQGTFTVVPEPRETGELVTHGPYAHIRHPMYTAALIGGLGIVLIRGSWMDGILVVLLGLVLIVKLQREERLLQQRYPDYAVYRSHTSALIPGLY